ncbi:MAG TPA: hypothetical protein VHN79_06975 [Lacunisphaera sp.]|nr:hypothetical protein [Lacunisphaera sp.]
MSDSPAAQNQPTDNLWVELVGQAIIARIRGIPTEELIHRCQERVVVLVRDTACTRILYDALELEKPDAEAALAQQSLTALMPPSTRIAILVGNTKVAYHARLAFGDATHRVFYNDLAGALAWLNEPETRGSVTRFK